MWIVPPGRMNEILLVRCGQELMWERNLLRDSVVRLSRNKLRSHFDVLCFANGFRV